MSREKRVEQYQEISHDVEELINQGKNDKALVLIDEQIEKCTTASDDDYKAFFEAVKIIYTDNDYNKAAKHLGECIENVNQQEQYRDTFILTKLGIFFNSSGYYDSAIKWFDKALDITPKDWMVMDHKGRAYYSIVNYHEAIQCFKNSLDVNPNNTDVMHHLCAGLTQIEQYDDAMSICDKILDKDVTNGIAMHSKGLILCKQGNTNEALDWFNKALKSSNHEFRPETYMWLGETYRLQNNVQAAIKYYTIAENEYNNIKQPHFASMAKSLSRSLASAPSEMNSIDKMLSELDLPISGRTNLPLPESRILEKINYINYTKYDEYATEYCDKPDDDVFAMLRGWGSAVGLLPSKNASSCRGGGYFLKWRGKGLLIDPGFDCLKNLHEAKFHCREVNAVVVSHNHTDHNDDLRSFDDIRYEMYKRTTSDDEKKAWEYTLFYDCNTANQLIFDPEKAQHRQVKRMPLQDTCVDPVIQPLNGLPFTIHWFGVKHGDDVKHALGIRVDCHNEDNTIAYTVGYTGDTEYFDELADSQHLGGCNVLLAHISMPDPEEYTNKEHIKPIHLGYRGVQKLVTKAKPGMTIVGEFWGGIADIRIDLIQGLRTNCKTDKIYPASIGMQIKPSTHEIRCSCCREWCAMDDIQIGSPSIEYGPLSYLCKKCRL